MAREGLGSRHIQTSGAGSGASTVKPYDIFTKVVANQHKIVLYPGTVNQYVPQSMFDEFTYTTTGTFYVYVRVTTNGRSVTSATVQVSVTPPLPLGSNQSIAPTQFDVMIGVVVKDKIFQLWRGNILATIQSAGTEDKPAPTPGLSPTIPYYTWLITVGA